MSYGTGKRVKVVHREDADHPGYERVILSGPLGRKDAGTLVRGETDNGTAFEILVHGQREFDVPSPLSRLMVDGESLL